MSKSRKSSTALAAFDTIPDEWKSINDIPQIGDMVERIQSDPIFADQFFFQETNNPENSADGTYQPLAGYQGYLFDTLDKNDVVWIQASRGAAKSSSVARWLDGYCLRFPSVKAGLFAPSFRQSKHLHDFCVSYITANSKVDSHIYKIEKELAADPIRGQEVLMKFKNKSSIESLPAGGGEKLRGKRFNVIAIDEAYLLEEEFHVSHILPMGNVKIGGRNTKTIYMTTSYYTDVYAYSILKNIARQVALGTPGYAIVSIDLNDVLQSGFPYDKKHILHQLQDQSDTETGKLSDEAKMTFFNIWIKSGSTFFTPTMVKECQRADVPIVTARPDGDKTPVVMGVDPATTGEDKCAMSVIGCPGNNDRRLRALYQFSKLKPEEIAGEIHKLVDLHGAHLILLDKSGPLGQIIADLCSKDLQLIDGTWQRRQPIMLWDHRDVRNSRAQIVLTFPSDDRIRLGVMGPRVDSAPQGELDLKNTFMLNMKSMFQNGKFHAPKLIKDEEYYNSEVGAIMDNITESLSQFPKIDRKRKPGGKEFLTDYRGNYHFTRPAKDDGAFSIIYGNYAANIHYRMLEGRRNTDEVPFLWGQTTDEQKLRHQTHKVVLAQF